MNQELSNEEKARIINLYAPKEIWEEGNNIGEYFGMKTDNAGWYNLHVKCSSNEPYWSRIELHKLLLTDLKDIKDEHAIELFRVNGNIIRKNEDDFGFTKEFAITTCKDQLNDLKLFFCFDSYQYLISKGYAVPLFFGLNHWANGQTAIQLNLAIPKKI